MKPHQFAINGEVLILRNINADGTSYNEFQNPLTPGETVTAPVWDPTPECGWGIHGWPWGLAMGDGKDPNWIGLWQVYSVNPADIVDLGGKCKFRTGTLKYSGDWQTATNLVLSGQIAYIQKTAKDAASATGDLGAASATGDLGAASATGSRGAASATGYQGAASATGDLGAASATGSRGAASATGYRGAASATGDLGAASATGDLGAASATGYQGAASATGSRGAASATGYRGAASATGYQGAAVVTGLDGKARAGDNGCIALAWWNDTKQVVEMRCTCIGKGRGKLKSNTWYTLNAEGKFIEVRA